MIIDLNIEWKVIRYVCICSHSWNASHSINSYCILLTSNNLGKHFISFRRFAQHNDYRIINTVECHGIAFSIVEWRLKPQKSTLWLNQSIYSLQIHTATALSSTYNITFRWFIIICIFGTPVKNSQSIFGFFCVRRSFFSLKLNAEHIMIKSYRVNAISLGMADRKIIGGKKWPKEFTGFTVANRIHITKSKDAAPNSSLTDPVWMAENVVTVVNLRCHNSKQLHSWNVSSFFVI